MTSTDEVNVVDSASVPFDEEVENVVPAEENVKRSETPKEEMLAGGKEPEAESLEEAVAAAAPPATTEAIEFVAPVDESTEITDVEKETEQKDSASEAEAEAEPASVPAVESVKSNEDASKSPSKAESKEDNADEGEEKASKKNPLSTPIPFGLARSFQSKPRHKAYAFNRSISFDAKKAKKEATKEGVPPKAGVPLLRRLSFRGRKERQAQLKETESNASKAEVESTEEAPAENVPAPRLAKPPLPKVLPPKPPRPATPSMVPTIASTPTPPITPTPAEGSKPEEEAEELAEQINEKLSKEIAEPSFQEEKKESDKEAAAASLWQNLSFISTRSKDSETGESKSGKGDSNRDGAETPKVEQPVSIEKTASEGSAKITKQKSDFSNASNLRSSASSSSSVAEKKRVNSGLAPAESVTEASDVAAKVEIAKSASAQAGKEDIAEDVTEVTDGEGDTVVREEKGGLVVTSSASEVEVSAGSNYFCEKFCCGLTLATAGST